jgi:hypothetical protein
MGAAGMVTKSVCGCGNKIVTTNTKVVSSIKTRKPRKSK